MKIDLGNALAPDADPGLMEAVLSELDERVADAHETIAASRADDEYGYAALNLPETTDPDAIRAAVAPLADSSAVLTVGIGGSALGAATLTDAVGAGAPHYVLDNVDPAHTRALVGSLPLAETAVHVVSRSGTTVETLANFLVVRDAMDRQGVDWTERTIVTTGPEGNLRRLAERHDLPVMAAPEGVPGRFAVLSSVGLTALALCDGDVDGVLAGARAVADDLSGSLYETPAYAYGAVAYGLDERGAHVNAMMPYAEGLETFAEWFAQLWAESLGKDGRGQTPVRALGATDQHSQLQLYRAGPRDKLVTLLRPEERPPAPIPDAAAPASEATEPAHEPTGSVPSDTDSAADRTGEFEGLDYLAGSDLGDVLDAEFEATEASLAAAGRPTVRLEIERLDAHSVGGLLYAMEAATILAGELYGAETFTQPAVEWGKRAARGLLGGEDAPEAEAVAEKRTLLVE